MRYDDLIYNPINEAQLTPGQVKAIKIKLQDYENDLRELNRKKMQLDDKFIYGDMPRELRDKVDAYVAAYTREVEKLKDQLKQSSTSRQFENLIAGIKKNCSEIVKAYQQSGRFLYTGFKNADNQTALYGKPNKKLNLNDYHASRNGKHIQTLIEKFHPEMSFENAVFASSNAYEISQGDRKAFIIFPKNGFKYFWPYESSNLSISTISVYRLFDRPVLKRIWDRLIRDPEMLNKFRKAGGDVPYPQEEYVGEPDGFMGKYTWENNIDTIEKMINAGDLSTDWGIYLDWVNLVSEESFDKNFKLMSQQIETAITYGHDCIINTSGLYAIDYKYKKQVTEALGN